MRYFYDLGILLGLCFSLPRILWKKKGATFWRRLTSRPPDPGRQKVIWLHAVSLGEIKSARGLLETIRAHHPDRFLLVTTCTAAGFEEAHRACKSADAIAYMPFDFSFVMRRWAHALRPELLILVESDVWWQHLTQVKQVGGQIALVSGKLSERSARRFALVPWLAKALFSPFDHILVQNESYLHRFAALLPGFSLQVGGNLKLNAVRESRLAPIDLRTLRSQIGFSLVLVSTHAPEEEELLDALDSIQGTIFLAPRHPERFDSVAALLAKRNLPFIRWSQIQNRRGGERVILVDAIGQLPHIYDLSELAIVAGSFGSKIGGHNVLEPCLYGLPVFFGPSMHNQMELASRVLTAGAGKQVAVSDLAAEIRQFLQDPTPLKQGALVLSSQSGEALKTTWHTVASLLKSKSLEINHLSC